MRLSPSSASGEEVVVSTSQVHSFSRFFRDSFQFELHRRSLEKHNVALISITQAVTDDPGGQMFRQLCAAPAS